MNTETLRNKLQNLVDEVNSTSGVHKIRFHQQIKTKSNMAIMGCNGSIWITPAPNNSYDISLSGQSLVNEMESFMCRICGKDKHGYKFPKIPRAPFWRVADFKIVKKAVVDGYINTIK